VKNELDQLWEAPLGGSRSWFDLARPEVRAECERIADRIIERGGQEPNWAAVRRYLDAKFPDDPMPTSKAGLSDNIRRLVKVRS
jgi:hypothetical protein